MLVSGQPGDIKAHTVISMQDGCRKGSCFEHGSRTTELSNYRWQPCDIFLLAKVVTNSL